ncbi:MAG: FAD-dependent oxidoreductase, partial [Halanaerobiaceae bacterium]
SDGKMEPASLMVKVGGINPEKAVYPTFGRQKELQQKMRKEVEKGNIPFPAGHIIIIETTVPEMAILNMTNSINIDGTKPEDLTEAEFKCREQIQPIIKFVRENVPGFKNCYLVGTASHIGIRETRHFSGLYRLKEEDIAAGKIFDDWVVSRCNRNFGAHNLSGSGSDEQNQKLESSEYTIPYRSFLPEKVDNLYLTGRCISGTHMAHSSYRVMTICMAMGQATGTGAALSIEKGVDIKELEVKTLQKQLIEQGVEKPI